MTHDQQQKKKNTLYSCMVYMCLGPIFDLYVSIKINLSLLVRDIYPCAQK